jgi:hypothetical protein
MVYCLWLRKAVLTKFTLIPKFHLINRMDKVPRLPAIIYQFNPATNIFESFLDRSGNVHLLTAETIYSFVLHASVL